MKFHLPFLQKKNVVSAGYDIQGKNNKIIIVAGNPARVVKTNINWER